MDVSTAAAKDDSFLYGCPGSIEGIFHTEFGFLHLGLCSCADADDCDTACQLGKTLLELLAVEIRLGLFDLLLDLGDTLVDRVLLAESVDNDGLFLADLDALGAAELLHGSILELQAEVGADDSTAGQDSDILEHGFPSVAVAGCLDSDNVESAAQLVDDEGRQSFALDVLSHDQEPCAHFDDLLEHGKNILDGGDLLICDQDEGILEVGFHLVHICRHICTDVAPVKLHAFDQIQLGQHSLGLLDGDNAVLGDLFHRVRDHLSYVLIAGGNSRDLLDMILALNGSAHSLDSFNSSLSSFAHTLAQDDRVRACSEVLHTFIDHSLCKYSRGRCAVAGNIIGLGCDFLDELGAHVFKSILKLDLLGDGHTVIGDSRSAVGLVQNNVPALGPQSDLYCISQLVDTFSHCHARICAVFKFLCHGDYLQNIMFQVTRTLWIRSGRSFPDLTIQDRI